MIDCSIIENFASLQAGGVSIQYGQASLKGCTISGNVAGWSGGGVRCFRNEVSLEDSIIWGNAGGAIETVEAALNARFSCIEGGWPGEGNIGLDPLFCGWGSRPEVFVDPARQDGGDGTSEHPYAAIADAFEYDMALSRGSPCLGTGTAGRNLGAPTEVTDCPAGARRLVRLAQGIYPGRSLRLAHRVSLAGVAERDTVIEGTITGLRSAASVSDLTVRRGTSGGILIPRGEAAEIRNVTIHGNMGWGIRCEESSPQLIDCTISANRGPGMYIGALSSPRMIHCTIAANLGLEGWGLYANGSYSLESCIVWGNQRGSISFFPPSAEILRSCIEAEQPAPGPANTIEDPLFCGWGELAAVHVNPAGPPSGDGSAATPFPDLFRALDYGYGLSEQSPCRGSGENASDRGARKPGCGRQGVPERLVHLSAGNFDTGVVNLQRASIRGAGASVTIISGTVYGLRTGASLSRLTVTGGTDSGIQVTDAQSPEIIDCSIEGNSGYFGGGISCLNSTPSVINCTIRRNRSFEDGGGVYGGARLMGCTISGNVAEQEGGGLSDPAALIGCTVDGNRARNGGGVSSRFTDLTVDSCRLTGNVSYQEGGGVYSLFTSLVVVNCIVDGNSGGGIHFRFSKPTSMIVNSTVTGNSRYGMSTAGSGIAQRRKVTNSIFWGNPDRAFLVQLGPPEQIALLYTITDQTWPGVIYTANPLFRDPGRWDNGGTEDGSDDRWIPGDYHLLDGSRGIDGGTMVVGSGWPPVDIEGTHRPCGRGIDIGAYERGGCGRGLFVRGDANADGNTDIGDGIAILGFLLGIDEIPCQQAGDVDDDGALDITDAISTLNFLFLGGKAIEPPVGACGADPTEHDLPCVWFPGCE